MALVPSGARYLHSRSCAGCDPRSPTSDKNPLDQRLSQVCPGYVISAEQPRTGGSSLTPVYSLAQGRVSFRRNCYCFSAFPWESGVGEELSELAGGGGGGGRGGGVKEAGPGTARGFLDRHTGLTVYFVSLKTNVSKDFLHDLIF